ncbi:MAG: sulfotransferase family protein [Spirochaetota bacterium]
MCRTNENLPTPEQPSAPIPEPHRNYSSRFRRLATIVRVMLRHRRYAKALLWGIAGPPAYILTRFFLWLDTIVYPELRTMTLTEPVFIVGHPRSGTTFLQKQLYRTGKASMYRTWELWFPSLTQRRLLEPIVGALRQLGLRQIAGPETGHEVKLDEVEEDEAILLHEIDTETFTFICPWLLVDDDVSDFGLRLGWINRTVTRRTMRFYNECLKRQLVHTGRPHVVAKSTPSVFRLRELLEMFPDARIIYVAREPEESIRSYLAMHERHVGPELTPDEAATYFRRKYRWGVNLYAVFEKLKSAVPAEQLMILFFEELVHSTAETMKRVLDFARIDHPGATLVPRAERRRKHRNPPLESFGLEPDRIARDLAALRLRYTGRRRRRSAW